MRPRASRLRGREGRPFRSGQGEQGTWISVGPSQALYPLTPFRNSFNYVPTRYVAGGRTTAIAIAPTCKPGDCMLYITPAGGGVWRTKNALSGQPNWEYLGGPLGINAAGAVTIDPNDPSGNTVYVGTGEANICGSGCVAGIGLYKSTNGGNTWTGPLGGAPPTLRSQARASARSSSSRAARTRSTSRTTTALRGMSEVCCSGVTRPVPGTAKWGLYKSTNGGATWSFIHNGSTNAADCTGSLDGVHQRRRRARRAASGTSSSTRRTRRSSTPPRTRAASGARPTAARRGRRSSRPSTPP